MPRESAIHDRSIKAAATAGRCRVLLEEIDADDYPHESINQLFLSAANVYKDRVIGVILTGMLKDGTTGLRAIAQAGGVTIVQADGKHR